MHGGADEQRCWSPFTSSALATLFGTAAALDAAARERHRCAIIFDGLTYVAIMVPGIVIGISTLIALVTTFDAVNHDPAGVWPGDAPPKLGLGFGSLICRAFARSPWRW